MTYKDILLLAHKRADTGGFLCYELDRMWKDDEINTYALVQLKQAINRELAQMRGAWLRADTLCDVLHDTGVLRLINERDRITPEYIEQYLPLRLEFIDRVLKSFDRELKLGTIVP